MKVLKFGGTSVGSVDSIRQIQQIIARQTDDCIVVVSALGGITDQLLRAAHLALENGEEYMELLQKSQIYQAVDSELADEIAEMEGRIKVLQYEDTLENWKNQYRRISTGEM